MTHTIGVFAALFEPDGRMVLVRQAYRGQCWTQPGGRLEPGEAPVAGLLREIEEETGARARVTSFIGAYAWPERDDLLLHFRAEAADRPDWTATDEILECRAFDPSALPEPMRPHTRARIADALAGRLNVFRTLSSPQEAFDL